jgi:hypothetical protein
MTVELLAQGPPVQLHEWMLFRDFFYHPFRNSRAVTQSRQMQLTHFAAAAHIVHQVERISFAANKGHQTHPATSNLPVVYFTSTTAFNVRFIPLRQNASKALTLPLISLRIEADSAFPFERIATALEDTRTKSACSITFLAPFHLFRASINGGLPYSSLDAFQRNMLPVSRRTFCCTPFALEPLLARRPQGMKHAISGFVVANEQSAL